MFVALERLLNLQEGYRETFQVAGRPLLLLMAENQPYLLENRCPHQGASLQTARLHGGLLRCARHGIEFDLASGRALGGQCPALTLLPLVYDGDRIGVDL